MPPSKPPKRQQGSASGPSSGPYQGLGTKPLLGLVLVAIAAIAWQMTTGGGLRGHPATVPFEAPLLRELQQFQGSYKDAMLWGTYRPGYYFGMRMRQPESLLAGLMWWDPQRPDFYNNVRHEATQNDGLRKFGWLQHDGSSYGHQELLDTDYNITTTVVKSRTEGSGSGGDWAVRLTCSLLPGEAPATPLQPGQKRKISFVVYAAEEGADNGQRRLWRSLPQGPKPKDGRLTLAVGSSPGIGRWALQLTDASKSITKVTHFARQTGHMHNLTDLVRGEMQIDPSAKKPGPGKIPKVVLSGKMDESPSVLAFKVTASLPLSMTIVFVSGGGDGSGELGQESCLLPSTADASPSSCLKRTELLSGESLRQMLRNASESFESRFEGFLAGADGYQDVARAALSNMLGGMGYFYGSSLVALQQGSREQVVESWDAPLYSAVPSRAFFPRGFLWDEGFHQLLVSRWDPKLSSESLAHWLDLLSSEGWIPREQIRGKEAQSRVPGEFIVQRPLAANPPTLFLPILQMAQQVDKAAQESRDGALSPDMAAQKEFLITAFPRLEKWFLWFNSSQAGPVPGSYRWRGREENSDRELNPKTLTSGLDDFPRASHPSGQERHVDLRCWMALASRALANIGHLAGFPESRVEAYRTTAAQLEDYRELVDLHFDRSSGLFLDWGNHTEDVKLEKKAVRQAPGQPPQNAIVRVATGSPSPGFVPHAGYVTLFPFLMMMIPPDAEEMLGQVALLQDPSHMWTPYGLRSLSQRSSMYGKHNTEHDGPYWRGAIWININYLALRALNQYSRQEGPYQSSFATLYQKLRLNLLGNVATQYDRTGYLWEQYNDGDGQGKGCKPFTGWTALVTLIAAEIY